MILYVHTRDLIIDQRLDSFAIEGMGMFDGGRLILAPDAVEHAHIHRADRDAVQAAAGHFQRVGVLVAQVDGLAQALEAFQGGFTIYGRADMLGRPSSFSNRATESSSTSTCPGPPIR